MKNENRLIYTDRNINPRTKDDRPTDRFRPTEAWREVHRKDQPIERSRDRIIYDEAAPVKRRRRIRHGIGAELLHDLAASLKDDPTD